MRLYLKTSPNTQTVPFEYQHFLTGRFHAWLGENDLHDGLSLYSLSWLSGGKKTGNGLAFMNGAQWSISAHDPAVLEAVCRAAQRAPEICCGMEVVEIQIIPTPELGERQVFKVASPVLARGKQVDGKVQHYIYSDQESDTILTQTLRRKLDQAGLGELAAQTQVSFDRSYAGARTKLVKIHEIANRASVCPVIVEGPAESVKFAWQVGVGHLTGSCFGFLR